MADTNILRGMATVSFFAADMTAAKKWYTELLGIEPYFQRPDAENPAYIEFRIGDYQHELGIIDSKYRPKGASAGRRQANYARMAEMAAQQPAAPAPAPAPLPAAFPTTSPEPEQPAEEEKLLGRLVTISGLEVNEIPITTPEFTIGRDPSCQYIIDQPFISPRHCMIMLRKNTFFIRDLGAKNGTFVNGERLPKNRDIPVPIGSEVNITMNISMELWDAKTVVKLTERRTSMTHHSTVTKTAQASDELELRSVFGIKFSGEDEGKVGDDYSPI